MFGKAMVVTCAFVCAFALVHGQVSMRAFGGTTSLPVSSVEFASDASAPPASDATWSSGPDVMPYYGYPTSTADLIRSGRLGLVSHFGYPSISANSMFGMSGGRGQGLVSYYGYPTSPTNSMIDFHGKLGQGGIQNIGYPSSPANSMISRTGARRLRTMPNYGYPTGPAGPIGGASGFGVTPSYGNLPINPASSMNDMAGGGDGLGHILHLGLLGLGGDNLKQFSVLSMCQDPRYTQMCLYMYMTGKIF